MANNVVQSHELPKYKNNGPWIASIVGACFIIPHYIILGIWTLLGNTFEEHVEGPGSWAVIAWNLAAVLMVIGLVVSFFGKSARFGKLSGLINLAIGVILIVLAFVGTGAYLMVGSGITFVIAGLLAIRNSGLPVDNVTLA